MSQAPNVRLVDPLKGEAAGYARTLGISLNALVAVAVRDYLDTRRSSTLGGAGRPQAAPAAEPEPAQRKTAPPAVPVPRQPVQQAPSMTKVGRNEPCPCGSGRKFKQCHGGGL